jgi:signal transduction histidine kinase
VDHSGVAVGPARRRLGVRGRSVLVAVGVVLVAMLIGGSGLVYVLEDNLETTATNTAADRAREIGEVITTIGLTEATDAILSEARSGQLVQIVDPDRAVFAASHRDILDVPMVALFPAVGESLQADGSDYLADSGDWAVVAHGVSARDANWVVQVAMPIGAERAAVRSVAGYLLVATPVLLAGVALAVWLLLGQALGAVDRIRREVAGIDSRNLSRRIEVPATGDEIASLASTMNTMLDRLQRADATQRRFVSDASHELRSPLATLTAAAELAQYARGHRRVRLLRTIRQELIRLQALVDDLMMLASASTAGAPLRRTDVDVDDLVDLQRQRLQATRQVEVVASIQPARIQGNPRQLEQAFRNLVDNAARHARHTVRLTVGERDGVVWVWVDNDGPPVPPQERERVFERFVRLDESRSRDSGGSGLGLAIARSSIEAHGGTLVATQAPDGWCRFETVLPLDDDGAGHPGGAYDPFGRPLNGRQLNGRQLNDPPNGRELTGRPSHRRELNQGPRRH